MAFTAEDGTGLDSANSLVSVAYADAYFLLRVNAEWAALSTELKQKHLVLATDYVEMRFSQRFIGDILVSTQALSWPRYLAVTFPDRVKNAICEYALISSSGKLVYEPITSDGQLLKRKRERFVQFEEEMHYETGANGKFLPHPKADAILAPYLRRGGDVIR